MNKSRTTADMYVSVESVNQLILWKCEASVKPLPWGIAVPASHFSDQRNRLMSQQQDTAYLNIHTSPCRPDQAVILFSVQSPFIML